MAAKDCPPDTQAEIVRWSHNGRPGWAQVCRQFRGPFRLWVDGRVVAEGRYDDRGRRIGVWVLDRDSDGTVLETHDFGDGGPQVDAR
jgi:hypothetical protein